MFSELITFARESFWDSFFELVKIALLGGVVGWAVFIGRGGASFAPSKIKILYAAIPYAVLAFLVGLYFYKDSPNSLRPENAVENAVRAFYYVLIPLWSGCVWDLVNRFIEDDKRKNPQKYK